MACTHGRREVHLHDPQTLYRHWEEQQWSPFDVALEDDAGQWADMARRTATSCCGRCPR